ncbi:MAG: Deferrochelatase/peroxidase, partial [Microbacteriaceae bacterium]|nr:Deferrochelatase/peroxidase [Microbacteriaceae bacterium]
MTRRESPVGGGFGRRSFVSGLIGAGVAAPLALGGAAAPALAASGTGATSHPFEGDHQQGILTTT